MSPEGMVFVRIAAMTALVMTQFVTSRLSTKLSVMGQPKLKILNLVTAAACLVKRILPHWHKQVQLQKEREKRRGGWVEWMTEQSAK